MAFYMKGTKGARGRIEVRARGEFKNNRNKTFIRSLTWAKKATGNNVNSMSSGAGVVSRSGKERAAKGLARQETASDVKHGFTPLKPARVTGSNARRVDGRNRHNKLNYVDLTMFRRDRLMKALVLAQKVKKPVYIKGRRGNRKYIARPMGRTPERFANGNSRVRLKFLYIKNKGGVARLRKKVPFVQMAGRDASKKFDEYFLDEFDYMFK
jgi:hypothetical protein